MKKKMLCTFLILFLLSLSLSFDVTSIQLEKNISDCDCINFYTPLTDNDIRIISEEIKENKWSYTVDLNSATVRSMEELCGLVIPDNWEENAKFVDPIKNPKIGILSTIPESFDWRANLSGLPKIKSQEDCGSCWAFATVGQLECAIRRVDGKNVDLSEQFLVSCATEYNGCDGGYFAHNYHVYPGAVLESDFPYEAVDYRGCNGYRCGLDPVKCRDCTHVYKLDNWAYIGDSGSIPSVNAIKRAIYNYGPVSAAVFVDANFHSYSTGIFDSDDPQRPNHAIILVGWKDDSNVTNGGYWILRNSWGDNWGENGYMRIAYKCNSVGFAANFIEYKPGQTPAPPEGGDLEYSFTFNVLNITNDPNLGYGQIDASKNNNDNEKPEWYYRIYFKSKDNSNNKEYQENNANSVFDWISDYTWNVNKKHTFKSKNPVVEITFCLFDKDIGGYDIADISADPSNSYFRATYDFSTTAFDKENTDFFTFNNSIYTTQGDNKDNNAKLTFSISSDYQLNYRSDRLLFNNLFFVKIFNFRLFSVINNLLTGQLGLEVFNV